MLRALIICRAIPRIERQNNRILGFVSVRRKAVDCLHILKTNAVFVSFACAIYHRFCCIAYRNGLRSACALSSEFDGIDRFKRAPRQRCSRKPNKNKTPTRSHFRLLGHKLRQWVTVSKLLKKTMLKLLKKALSFYRTHAMRNNTNRKFYFIFVPKQRKSPEIMHKRRKSAVIGSISASSLRISDTCKCLLAARAHQSFRRPAPQSLSTPGASIPFDARRINFYAPGRFAPARISSGLPV